MQAGMHKRVMEAARLIANSDQFCSLESIREEEEFQAKGILNPIKFYRINAMPNSEVDQSILSA